MKKQILVLGLWLLGCCMAVMARAGAKTYLQEDFEQAGKLPEGWETKGDVTVTEDEKFRGTRSLKISRAADKFDVETAAMTPAVAVTPGFAEIGGAFKTDFVSPDVSFNVAVTLLCLDSAGSVLSTIRIAEQTGKTAWTPLKKQVEIPTGTVAARLRFAFDKVHGCVWVDNLTFAPVAATEQKSPIQRILLKTAQPGNMFFLGDKALFEVSVETSVPLEAGRHKIKCTVTDYWGAEEAPCTMLELQQTGCENGAFVYRASLDLSAITFKTGKYYELHTLMDTGGDGEAAREFSSFVFLPSAEAKKHPWKEIPFSTRNWDNRIKEYFILSDRIGLPLMGVWGSWKPEPPYNPSAPGIDFCVKSNLGVLTRTPIVEIEHHREGYEKHTEESMRAGIREFFQKFGTDGRLTFVLGNEPEVAGETVAANVKFYKLMYEEIKKISPETFVVGTSVGPAEEYFKLGFQHYCDAVDFHTYGEVSEISNLFEEYKKLFAKYGGAKPVWSTETGLNSQGLPRRLIAADLIKKVSIFFAEGGQNISWFGICYPDRQGKLRGAADDSFNVFNGLYGLYSPRLDAVAYYNMVNGICVKKFADRKQYDKVQAYLFRDKENKVLQVLWQDHGARDAFISLPGVSGVQVTHIDGTIVQLDAAKKGITLRIGEDPLLLQYTSEQTTLPAKLDEPLASIVALPACITRGEPAKLTLKLKSEAKKGLSIGLPPGWKLSAPGESRDGNEEYTLTSPADTGARLVPLYITIESPGTGDGDLFAAVPVQGQLGVEVYPVADVAGPMVEVEIRNHNAARETVQWKVSLAKEIPVKEGCYTLSTSKPPEAYFGESTQDQVELAPRGSAKVRLPLVNIDPLNAYKITALLTDKLGRFMDVERIVGGFVAVPKVHAPVKMDGSLSDVDWARCKPQKLSENRQYRRLAPGAKWAGVADLSGEIRFLWDDQYLYIGVNVTDDVFHNESTGAALWNGDGVQLLVDPTRGSIEKSGKYDLGMALTPQGPQAWCFTSGDARVPAGNAPEILVAAKKADNGTGAITYEIAIPWNRLLPFRPAAGADLGMAVALNEDDYPKRAKRDAFMAWFGDIQSKEVSPVGDLILVE